MSGKDWQGVEEKHALFAFEQAEEDSDHTDSKSRQLLTLSASLATVLLVFGPAVTRTWAVVVPSVGLIATVYLSLQILAVRTIAQPIPESVSESSSWGQDLMTARDANVAYHRYRVDLYRASRRWFVLSLIVAAFLPLMQKERMNPQIEAAGIMTDSVRAVGSDLSDDLRSIERAISDAGRTGPDTGLAEPDGQDLDR